MKIRNEDYYNYLLKVIRNNYSDNISDYHHPKREIVRSNNNHIEKHANEYIYDSFSFEDFKYKLMMCHKIIHDVIF